MCYIQITPTPLAAMHDGHDVGHGTGPYLCVVILPHPVARDIILRLREQKVQHRTGSPFHPHTKRVTNPSNEVVVIHRSRSGMPAVPSRSESWLGTLTASAVLLGMAVYSAPVAGTASSAIGMCGSGGTRRAAQRLSRMSRYVWGGVWARFGSGGTWSL